jgi:hypothetical protein
MIVIIDGGSAPENFSFLDRETVAIYRTVTCFLMQAGIEPRTGDEET